MSKEKFSEKKRNNKKRKRNSNEEVTGILNYARVQAPIIIKENIITQNSCYYSKQEVKIGIKKKEELIYEIKHFYSRSKTFPRFTEMATGLDIDSCFINLSIIPNKHQQQNEKNFKDYSSNFSKIYSSYEELYNSAYNKKLIACKELFGVHLINKGARHILVLGRAGIGKSVLSQYLSYQWAKDELWKEKFDLVIKIALREVTESDSNLAVLIENHCLSRDPKYSLKRETIKKILKKIDSNKILLIFDGYDEFSFNNKNMNSYKLINDLIIDNKYPLIVTSRPYVTIPNANAFDTQLECMGFSTDNIYIYITKICIKTKKQQQIYEFLKNNPAVHALAHVPLILDIVCASWKMIKGNVNKGFNATITTLYQEITQHLWKRYDTKLKERFERKKTSSKKIKIEIGKLQNDAKRFLSHLAFMAMESNHIIIPYKKIKDAITSIYETSNNDAYELINAGFLHRNKEQQVKSNESYYFPHLTFQEFFAAHYLKSRIEEELHKSVDAQEKFKKELLYKKYDARYELVWHFLAGLLLELKEREKALEYFFGFLIANPKDLVHLHYINLLIRCLEESQVLNSERLTPNQFSPYAILNIIKKNVTYYAGLKDSLLSVDVSKLSDALKLSPQVQKKIGLIGIIKKTIEEFNKHNENMFSENKNTYYYCRAALTLLTSQTYLSLIVCDIFLIAMDSKLVDWYGNLAPYYLTAISIKEEKNQEIMLKLKEIENKLEIIKNSGDKKLLEWDHIEFALQYLKATDQKTRHELLQNSTTESDRKRRAMEEMPYLIKQLENEDKEKIKTREELARTRLQYYTDIPEVINSIIHLLEREVNNPDSVNVKLHAARALAMHVYPFPKKNSDSEEKKLRYTKKHRIIALRFTLENDISLWARFAACLALGVLEAEACEIFKTMKQGLLDLLCLDSNKNKTVELFKKIEFSRYYWELSWLNDDSQKPILFKRFDKKSQNQDYLDISVRKDWESLRNVCCETLAHLPKKEVDFFYYFDKFSENTIYNLASAYHVFDFRSLIKIFEKKPHKIFAELAISEAFIYSLIVFIDQESSELIFYIDGKEECAKINVSLFNKILSEMKQDGKCCFLDEEAKFLQETEQTNNKIFGSDKNLTNERQKRDKFYLSSAFFTQSKNTVRKELKQIKIKEGQGKLRGHSCALSAD